MLGYVREAYLLRTRLMGLSDLRYYNTQYCVELVRVMSQQPVLCCIALAVLSD